MPKESKERARPSEIIAKIAMLVVWLSAGCFVIKLFASSEWEGSETLLSISIGGVAFSATLGVIAFIMSRFEQRSRGQSREVISEEQEYEQEGTKQRGRNLDRDRYH